jgi:hypothetical protein
MQLPLSTLFIFSAGRDFIAEHQHALPIIDQLAKAPSHHAFRKDLGGRDTLRTMSRRLQVVVRGGGHVDMFTPLYV